jgi:hypothetical protein
MNDQALLCRECVPVDNRTPWTDAPHVAPLLTITINWQTGAVGLTRQNVR